MRHGSSLQDGGDWWGGGFGSELVVGGVGFLGLLWFAMFCFIVFLILGLQGLVISWTAEISSSSGDSFNIFRISSCKVAETCFLHLFVEGGFLKGGFGV